MALRRECEAFAAALTASSRVLSVCEARGVDGLLLAEVAVEPWVRCDEVRGGGMGPGAIEVEGDECADEAMLLLWWWARGVVMGEFCDTLVEW